MFLLRVFLEFSIYSTVVLLRGERERNKTQPGAFIQFLPVTNRSFRPDTQEGKETKASGGLGLRALFPPWVTLLFPFRWLWVSTCRPRSWAVCSVGDVGLRSSVSPPRLALSPLLLLGGLAATVALASGPGLSLPGAPGQRSLPAAALSLSPSAPRLPTFWPQTFSHTQPPPGTHAEAPAGFC